MIKNVLRSPLYFKVVEKAQELYNTVALFPRASCWAAGLGAAEWLAKKYQYPQNIGKHVMSCVRQQQWLQLVFVSLSMLVVSELLKTHLS